MVITKNIKAIFSVAVVLSILYTDVVLAQSEIEEVTVTARKREESIQDVPASILVIQGEEIQNSGYFDVQSLSESIPNFHYSQNVGASDNLIIRGLGTIGSGPHFEPGVGQVFNGVFLSRTRFGRSNFMDLGQVEVLRGPQGSVLGKNTSLGAVVITPNKPTEDFEGSFFVNADFADAEGFEYEGVVSGPLADAMRGRFAFNFKNKDGHIENNVTNEKIMETTDRTFRAIVDTDITEVLGTELMWQHLNADRNGKAREIVYCSGPISAAAMTDGEDCSANARNVARNFAHIGPDGGLLPQGLGGVLTDLGEPLRMDTNLLSNTFDFSTDHFDINWNLSYLDYEIEDWFDSDLRPIENRHFRNNEDFEQYSTEFRVNGDLGDQLSYIVGANYTDYEINFVQDLHFIEPHNTSRRDLANANSEGYGIFGDVTFDVSEQFSVNSGARYITEDKDAKTSRLAYQEYFGNNIDHTQATALIPPHTTPPAPPDPNTDYDGSGMREAADDIAYYQSLAAQCNTTGAAAGFRQCSVTAGSRSDDEVTWNLNLQWRPWNDTMFYVSAAKGFKSGGFVLQHAFTQAQIAAGANRFDPEISQNYEIGGRHDFPKFRFNWTIFNTDIEDLQVSGLDPDTLTQTINNAAEARSRGVELELNWLPIEPLELSLNGAYTDSEYKSFTGAPCWGGQTAAQGCAGGIQNLSGRQISRAPELQFIVDGKYTIGFHGYDLSFGGKVFWSDEYFIDTELSPFGIQDSFHKIDASIKLASKDGTWDLQLVGKNLNDEHTLSFYNESAALTGYVGANSAFAFPDLGRTVALKARYHF